MGQKLTTALALHQDQEGNLENFAKINNVVYYAAPVNYKGKTICKYAVKRRKTIEKKEIPHDLSNFEDFWLVLVKLKNTKQGWIPSNCTIKHDGRLPCLEAWRNIQRAEAKQLLMNPQLKTGTYILRPSSRINCYALSVRDIDKNTLNYTVKHFLIKTIPEETDEEYYSDTRKYPDIYTLINYFEEYGIGTNRTKLNGTIPQGAKKIFEEKIDNISNKKWEIKNVKDNPTTVSCISISKSRLKLHIRHLLDIFGRCTA